MNVPSKFKGFSKLPESVQQKMSPELAEKYNMGGAVMDRPLFRQMGGDVAPVPPAPAMPEAAAEGIMSAEMGMRDKAQMMAQDYLANTEQRLDMAESPEEVINAIRGNDRPVEDRYRELAMYVGEQDAMQTPESVLAMVQPTLMLTEEGALDSGIGDLVKNLAGDIEMETSEGDATAMGGGLGSLMMAGAGNTPPENFSQGGAVRLANGGEVRPYYDARLPIYQEIMGGGDDAKRMSQAQALFAISDAAGRFASGVGAQGQDVRGLSPAAQLAAATTGLGTQLGAIGAQTEQLDRQARLAALTAAESDLAKDKAAALAAANRPIGKMYEALDAKGNIIATQPLSTQSDYDAFQKANPNARIREKVPPKGASMKTMINLNDPTQIIAVDVNNAEDYKSAVGAGFVDLMDAKSIDDFRNPDVQQINLYSKDGVVTFDLSKPKERERYDKLRTQDGYSGDPTLFKTQIAEKSQMKVFKQQEEIKVANQIEAELRARGYRIEDEDRAELKKIAAEERAQGYKLTNDERAERFQIAKEERAKADEIERELRQLDTTLAAEERLLKRTLDAEDREVLREIAAEERALNRTLSAEERAQRYQELKEDRAEERDIAQELRQQGYIEAAEDRDFVRELAREERALERDLSKEERQQKYLISKEEREVARTIEAELRQEGYTVKAEDRAFLRQLAKEERELNKELSAEERKKKYDEYLYNRDRADADTVMYELDDGTTKVVRKGSDEEDAILAAGGAKLVSKTKSDRSLLEDTELMSRYASGDETLDPDTVAQIQRAINDYIKPQPGATVSTPVPPLVENAEKLRSSLGLSTTIRFPPPQPISTADNSALEKFGGAAFGTGAFFRNMVNLGVGLLDINAPAEQTETALTELNTLNESAKIAFRNIVPGRSQEAVNQFATTLPQGKALTGTRQKASKEVQALITLFRREVDKAQQDLTTIVSPSERASAENAILQSEAIIQAYEALLVGIKGGKKVGVDPSKFDKRKTKTTEN
tara:strand:+ start:763 stop:3768 length:3006 start_codon:yes stop_codon:yes gene_type:complete